MKTFTQFVKEDFIIKAKNGDLRSFYHWIAAENFMGHGIVITDEYQECYEITDIYDNEDDKYYVEKGNNSPTLRLSKYDVLWIPDTCHEKHLRDAYIEQEMYDLSIN